MAEILLLGNPKRRRKTHRRRAKSHHRRRSSRRMPEALRRYWAGVRSNPKRRRRRAHHARRRHVYRRNPSLRSAFSVNSIVSNVKAGAMGAAGGLANDLLYGYTASMLPSVLTTGYVLYATKLLYATLTGVLATAVLKEKGRALALGAMTTTIYNASKALLLGFVPTLPLSGYGEYLTGLGAIGMPQGFRNNSPMFLRRPLSAVGISPSVGGYGEYLTGLGDANFANGVPAASD